MSGHVTFLPPASELIDLIETTKYKDIADQHGVTPQAVHKRLDLYCRKRYGMSIRQYREQVFGGKTVE
jgi:predicted transcriptional regulator